MDKNLKEMNIDVGSKTISDILAEVSEIGDFSKKSSKLDFHVHALEEELRKIDAFKRELPNCMQLLKDAIERLKEERLQWKGREMGLMMEEFMLRKNDAQGDGRAKVSNNFSEKKNWMNSIQLWSTPVQYESNSALRLTSRYAEGEGNGSGCNFENRGGAFVPFKKPTSATMEEEKGTGPVHGLSLSTPVADFNVEEDCVFGRPRLQQPQQQEQLKKQRRCWSPELHKRFVDALHQLGGPQTATPKQIRELMKVDGLTNDEVKSHLQKYRIHIRKLPTSSSDPPSYSLLARDQCGDLSKPVVPHYGSPQGPFHQGKSAKLGSATGGDSMEEEGG